MTELAARRRILVVDDNEINLVVAVGILEKFGYETGVAGSGKAALKLLAEIPFDLVLMDCQMPDVDGYEACRLIRSGSEPVLNPAIPVIAVTAYAMTGDRERCLSAGMNDYVTKPIRPVKLRDTVQRWLGEFVPQTPEEDTLFDRQGLIERMMGSEDLAREVLTAFLDYFPTQLAALAEAVRTGDPDAAGRVAHSLRGAAGNAGGRQLLETAEQLEFLCGVRDLNSISALVEELDNRFARIEPAMRVWCRLHPAQSKSNLDKTSCPV